MKISDIFSRLAEKQRWHELKRLKSRKRFAPGNINIAGWNLDYIDSGAIASSIELLVYEGWNDFVTEKEAPVILDCGSNIGISVLQYRRNYPKSRITAFEPDPLAVAALRRNLAANGAADVRIIEAAVWTETGKVPFFVEGADGSRIISAGDNGASTIVGSIDLVDFLSGPVDLIKMDIEGAEFEVIPHIADKLCFVENMIVECHLFNEEIGGFAQLLQVLWEADFSVAVNSYGTRRDLVRRPSKLPNEFDQYIVLAAWKNRGKGRQ